jgi:hypothetical protein
VAQTIEVGLTDTSVDEKNESLRKALNTLVPRFPGSAWAQADAPFSALQSECIVLASTPDFMTELRGYLRGRTVLKRAIESFYTAIAMAARARWQEAAPEHRGVAARGWFLGRWIPTFLVIDGPIGRFFLSDSSPLTARLGPSYPVLTAAAELMREKTFRSLRNGFAHWAFDWKMVGKDSYVVAYDCERDLPIAKLHLQEADAFHLCAFALIEAVDHVLISDRAFTRDAT